MREAEASETFIAELSSSAPSSSTVSSEALLDALKMILMGTTLVDVLTSITRLIEAHSEGMLCSIFLVQPDGMHMRYAAAANLPEEYRTATDGAEIGPGRGPCSMAAYRKEPVFVADFLSDPDWSHFRAKPLSAGLLAGWSNPIIGHDGQVLGTFGMYFREVRNPSQAEIQLIAYASHVVGIAIERDRSSAALNTAFQEIRKSEGQLRQIVDAIPQTVVVLGADGSVVYVNRTVLDYTGLPREEAMESDFRERVFHPDDLERLRETRRNGFSSRRPWENEVRVRGKNGEYRWFLIRYNPVGVQK